MTAYWMARAKVHDPAQYQEYARRVPDILARHGGRILARGGDYRVLEGPGDFERFVVVEFPSLEQAVRCHACAEYQAAAALRGGGAGTVEIAIVEGVG